ncbi:MAG: diaminopimelate epimerase [Emcibacter sp.]|nr:diaminopimelate epimerase [Emcibacter sp.]
MTKEMTGAPRAFRKMHGLGNDFVIFDGRADQLDLTGDQARHIASRHHGIGCDQVITLLPSTKADVFMRIQNADGSEVGACGNASRCVGQILMEGNNTDQITIETTAGLLQAARAGDLIRVDMGVPHLDWQDIPLSREMATDDLDLTVGPLSHGVAVNMGNPHVVFFVDEVADIPLAELGPQIETHPLFPKRVNVSIVADQGQGRLRHRVWERGAGITKACGSGACAVIVAASLRGLVPKEATVELDGGDLHMLWDEDGHIQMTGSATHVFDGHILL